MYYKNGVKHCTECNRPTVESCTRHDDKGLFVVRGGWSMAIKSTPPKDPTPPEGYEIAHRPGDGNTHDKDNRR